MILFAALALLLFTDPLHGVSSKSVQEVQECDPSTLGCLPFGT
jgi:hypothetical protein